MVCPAPCGAPCNQVWRMTLTTIVFKEANQQHCWHVG